jgi:hypothetical protein
LFSGLCDVLGSEGLLISFKMRGYIMNTLNKIFFALLFIGLSVNSADLQAMKRSHQEMSGGAELNGTSIAERIKRRERRSATGINPVRRAATRERGRRRVQEIGTQKKIKSARTNSTRFASQGRPAEQPTTDAPVSTYAEMTDVLAAGTPASTEERHYARTDEKDGSGDEDSGDEEAHSSGDEEAPGKKGVTTKRATDTRQRSLLLRGLSYAPSKVKSAFTRAFRSVGYSFNAAKEVVLVGTDLTKAALFSAAIVVACVAIVSGLDFALAWAIELGLPNIFFNHYVFGTFFNVVKGYLISTVKAAPAFFRSLPSKIAAIPGGIRFFVETIVLTYRTGQLVQEAAVPGWFRDSACQNCLQSLGDKL